MKSISVWIPRLPTMRVIGSHDISLTTTWRSWAVRSVVAISGSFLLRGVSPRA